MHYYLEVRVRLYEYAFHAGKNGVGQKHLGAPSCSLEHLARMRRVRQLRRQELPRGELRLEREAVPRELGAVAGHRVQLRAQRARVRWLLRRSRSAAVWLESSDVFFCCSANSFLASVSSSVGGDGDGGGGLTGSTSLASICFSPKVLQTSCSVFPWARARAYKK